MKWPHVRIGDVCDLNPRLPKTHTLNDDDAVSFVPMAAVSELSGTIQTRSTRRFAEVRKGYTPFQNNDVLFAKITPCMENGKAAIARDLVHGYGFGSTEFHVLRAGENVLPEWLHFSCDKQLSGMRPSETSRVPADNNACPRPSWPTH